MVWTKLLEVRNEAEAVVAMRDKEISDANL